MTLGFKQFFPWHTKANPAPTYFREKILAGVGKQIVDFTADGYPIIQDIDPRFPLYKDIAIDFNSKGEVTKDEKTLVQYNPKLHTIREGNRWKVGDLMHMAYGVRTKNYQQFNKDIPELARVKSVQNIEIFFFDCAESNIMSATINIDGNQKWSGWVNLKTGVNDCSEFDRAFIEKIAINDGFSDSKDFFRWFNKDFSGQLIHWTALRY